MEVLPVRITRGTWDGSCWEAAIRPPAAPLRPYVRRLSGYDERAPGPRSQRQVPTPCVVLIVELGPPLRVTLGDDARTTVRHRGGFAAGIGDVFSITRHGGRQRGVQVDLTPTGARRLFGVPASEIAGRVVALSDLLPAELEVLSEQLEATSDWALRLDLVEALLTRRILDARLDTARVDHALRRIEAASGNLDVGSLSRELGCSRKHLIELFRDQVGVPPKLLARLVRFERLMREVRRGSGLRWAELAMEAGYCDQAHLARDVRRFAGITPTQARAEIGEVARLFG